MEILVLGLNHKTAPLEIREKFSIPPHRMPDLLQDLGNRRIFNERLLLSTCNRTELYGAGPELSGSVEEAKHFFSEYARIALQDFEDKLYVLTKPDSIAHLFRVTSGLDSMVIGETEIIGQVKNAYLCAHQTRHTGKVLNALFQRSLKVAKNLRTQTQIGLGRVSVASVAVELAEKIFGRLNGVCGMVLGTGDTSTQVAKAMASKGAQLAIVSSRHFERAELLAVSLGAEAIAYDQYPAHLDQTDILIAATLAPRVLIHANQVREWMKKRRQKPLFLIDLAVPRNIETTVEKIDNVYLYNIDDLQGIAERNRALRHSQLEVCSKFVSGQTERFMDWLCKEFGSPKK